MERPLWAPWRIEFIRGPKDNYCFLCDNREVSDRKEEKLIVFRGREAYIILNGYPYNSGHLLVAPYRHVGDLDLLTRSELYEMMDLCVLAEKILKKVMRPEAFNVGFNLGKMAGAGVAEHVHMHIVPRWAGDTNFMPVISDTRCVPEALEATAEFLRKEFNK